MIQVTEFTAQSGLDLPNSRMDDTITPHRTDAMAPDCQQTEECPRSMQKTTFPTKTRYTRGMSLVAALYLAHLLPAFVCAGEATSVTLDGRTYGAQADEIGPIGGGAGYKRTVTKGDFVVTNLDGLLAALAQAKPGQVVFIPGETEIDCTARVYIEKLVLEIPGGVTLAGNRGQDGSQGALICSDALDTKPLIRATGPKVRITGLRIRGPNPKRYLDHHRRSFSETLPDGTKRGHAYYYKFPVSEGIATDYPGLEIDNCEISGFSHSGIYLKKGTQHHIHHNFIHHCQYAGLGYGVCHDVASSLIERNLFDFNRHSIAGTGRPGCGYEARHNLVLGTSLSHCFDMHGGRDRKDGTMIAGTTIRIHHNTFRAPQTSIVIRGVPENVCEVFGNWFVRHANPKRAVRAGKKTVVRDNAYDTDPPRAIP